MDAGPPFQEPRTDASGAADVSVDGKVLLLETDLAMGYGSVEALESEGYGVGSARGIAEARRLISDWARHGARYVLISHTLRDATWIDLVRELRNVTPRPEVALLTQELDESSAASVEALGAWPLIRPSSARRLLDVIALLGRQRARLGTLPETVVETMDGVALKFGAYSLEPARLVALDGARALRPAEYRLLSHIARASGRIVPINELARRVLVRKDIGTEAGSAVRRQIANLRAALGSHASLIETVAGYGYRLNVPRPPGR